MEMDKILVLKQKFFEKKNKNKQREREREREREARARERVCERVSV